MDAKTMEFLRAHAPCYVYDQKMIQEHARKLLAALPGFSVIMSIKTNPFLPVVKTVAGEGIGADAASIEEVRIAARAGMQPCDIYYSAAGKTDAELREGLFRSVLTADSRGEIRRISALAKELGVHARIGIRVNPDFTMESDKGVTAKFGILEEELPELSRELAALGNVTVCGIHVHVKSQVLDAQKLGQYHLNVFHMAQRINALAGFEMEFVNFGGGIGTVYDDTVEKPLDFAVVQAYAEQVCKENADTLKARLIVESGRYLTCDAGTYYTKVIDIKENRGKKYVICQNGLNGFLRPVMTHTLNKLLPGQEFPPPEPMYTRAHAFEFDILNEETELETYDIVGNLCTAADILLGDAHMKKANVGDIVSISKAGAYAFALTPVMFSSHPAPGEYLFTGAEWISK
ncbi:MAG: alanine racemase [Clostridia bacterium]|nr:alanine racemase [Clostridia bacterium]